MVLIRSIKILVIVASLLAAAGAKDGLVSPVSGLALSAGTPRPTPVSRRKRYNEFHHESKAHQIECSSCHKFPSENWNKVRSAADAFPDVTEYPKHDSCVKCHQQQFFRGAPPEICSICHTTPGPRNSNRHPFPNPREIFDKSPKGKTASSDFVVGFPHDKHIEIVAGHTRPTGTFQNAFFARASRIAAEESCAVCHQTMIPQGEGNDEFVTKPPANIGDAFWLKKGTFKSVPTGHTTCFTCHSEDSGMTPAPKDCAACHKLRPAQPPSDFDPKFAGMAGDNKMMLDRWRGRGSSGTFRHEWFSHAEMACASCHSVEKINTADPRTTRVSVDSCATCHATGTLDDGGVLNFEMDARSRTPTFQCTKCHVVFGRQPVPPSHAAALKAATGKQ